MDCDKTYYDAYNQWLMNCMKIYHDHIEKVRKKRLSQAVKAIALCTKEQNHYKETEELVDCNVRPSFELEKVILSKKVLEDLSFHSYIRMSATQFEKLVSLVGKEMKKLNCIGKSIGVAESLLLTLKFLASGDSIQSVSRQYSNDIEEIETIIFETCTIIWASLVTIVMPSDLSKRRWLRIAQEFEEKWNFPHCIGAIDGVHVMIQEFDESNKITLLAICDANLMFTFIDMGTHYGQNGDKDIFKKSKIGCAFENGDMNLPDPSPLTKNDNDNDNFPYCLVGDEAFPLKTYLLRPYPQRDILEISRLNFNCRLISAQKTIETSFAILSNRWQILSKTLNMTVVNAMRIVQSCVCLHNWLRLSDLNGSGSIQYVTTDLVNSKIQTQDVLVAETSRKISEHSSAFKDISNAGNGSSRDAVQIRDKFLHYFKKEII